MPEIIKISYGLTIGDMHYGNSKPGVVEATLKPGETMEEALDELDNRLWAWHKERYPQVYNELYGKIRGYATGNWTPVTDFPEHMKTKVEFGPPPIIQVDKSIPYVDEKNVKEYIQSAKTLEELTSYKLLASKEPLYSLYMQRLKELTNGKHDQ